MRKGTVDRGARANAAPMDDDDAASTSLRERIADDSALDMELYEHAWRLVELRRRRLVTDP